LEFLTKFKDLCNRKWLKTHWCAQLWRR